MKKGEDTSQLHQSLFQLKIKRTPSLSLRLGIQCRWPSLHGGWWEWPPCEDFHGPHLEGVPALSVSVSQPPGLLQNTTFVFSTLPLPSASVCKTNTKRMEELEKERSLSLHPFSKILVVWSPSRVWLLATPTLQHTRLSCPSLSLGVCSDSCPLSWWCYLPISSSASVFFFAFNLFQHQGLFQWVISSHQVAKVLEFQRQHQASQWIFRVDFLYDWLVWSPWCLRNSQESSPAYLTAQNTQIPWECFSSKYIWCVSQFPCSSYVEFL